jgi:hypothetical protein
MLFSDRSVLTMIHGIGFGGAALMAIAAALFSLHVLGSADRRDAAVQRPSGSLALLTVFIAVVLWLAVLTGTYIIFPPYRATPPAGVTDLAAYPRSLVLASPETAWLHAFAMECKEHVPWIAAMLATAVAFTATRYRSRLLNDAALRNLAVTLLAVCFVLVAFAALMGTLVNKVAPLE